MPATFRRALATDLAALSAINTAAAASVAPDPIFAAIERHRAALAALATIDDAEPARHAAAEQEIAASAKALFDTPPTSIAGAKALATFVIEDTEADGVESRCLDTLKVLHRVLDRVAALSA